MLEVVSGIPPPVSPFTPDVEAIPPFVPADAGLDKPAAPAPAPIMELLVPVPVVPFAVLAPFVVPFPPIPVVAFPTAVVLPAPPMVEFVPPSVALPAFEPAGAPAVAPPPAAATPAFCAWAGEGHNRPAAAVITIAALSALEVLNRVIFRLPL